MGIMTVGHTGKAYPDLRCILNKVDPDLVQYVSIDRKQYDFGYLSQKVLHKLSGRPINWDLESCFRPVRHLPVDIIHTFNTVCRTDQPWCSTFETTLPRTNLTCSANWTDPDSVRLRDLDRRLYDELAKDNCTALLALSQSACAIQRQSLEALDKPARDRLLAKTAVLLPPQKLLLDDAAIDEKFAAVTDQIRFLFIGKQFFRKGGAQVIDVLKSYEKKASFHLTVVSSLAYGDNVSQTAQTDMERYRRLLETTDWITWHPALPNDAVLDLCRKAHVGLLPTFADTFGYAVLEMQAAGCPVITTDIRALPEINNDQTGWLCHLPKRQLGGEALYQTPTQRTIMKESLLSELKRVFEQVFHDTGSLQVKGRRAFERVRHEHDPKQYGQQLYQIYQKSLNRAVGAQSAAHNSAAQNG